MIEVENGKYYHIYNRGINSCNLFNNDHDFRYFLKLYNKYLNGIAETYAIALMSNHFHIVLKFNSNLEKPTHQYLSNLFSSYTKAFNLWNNRHGTLFERPFKRKFLEDDNYLKSAICYVNLNPIKHGIVTDIDDYKWISYNLMLLKETEFLQMENIYEMFGGIDDFINYHKT